MADKEINCMVQAVISATGCPDKTEQLSNMRVRQQSNNWGDRGYQEIEARHLAELLEAAGNPRRVEADAVESLDSLIATAQFSETINTYVFVGLPRTTQDARPHIVHIGKRASGGFQSDQQFLPDYEITEILAGQNEIPVFFAFTLG